MPGFSSSSSSSIHLSTHFSRKRGEETMPPQPEPSKANSSSPASNGSTSKDQKKVAVRYAQCRKNHAASIGGYAVDGCREFMASGEAGTAAALLCAACTCHRSFHKREVEFDPPPPLSGSSSTSSSDSQVEN